ncbi:flavin reductase [Enterococcus phoeniculicola]|jgi:chromate reductase|uniref:Flavin reductase n=1 Tax=Enterococcus phoeniculicola ATCC BAA-412 TaxID=1158610 RepID=R3TKU6_9ENTE|nr:NAD(P)H-dependent oxidoreductase [Enterococcus phoeniculicola]EOL42049.1 flavin reductase [Enterococcus phoeniculicola ATCC BAA-412]EOT79672.1 flavin reductase [Enterococcus phoeniculicola ATCC BAA-412]OJG71738.1 flavin reductase [Enterococcus phoeniculicola]
MTKKIGFLVGSLRKESFSKKVATAIAGLFPSDFEPVFISLDDLDMYNQDFDDENRAPASWTTFRETVKDMTGFVFVTPEYNRSVPAVLKNALDVGSRPYGQSVWDGKPGLVVSVSPGALSGFGANHHLRQSLVFLNVPTLQQPEAYLGNVMDMINEDGTIVEGTMTFLKTIVDTYVAFYEANKKA